MNQWHVYRDADVSLVHENAAVANMAVDAALGEGLGAADAPVLRWYGWPRRTLSIGYFQTSDAADRYMDRHGGVDRHGGLDRHGDRGDSHSIGGGQVVRRSTGGGAIVHHHDRTYCLVVPNDCVDRWIGSRRPDDLYRWWHGGVAHALRRVGIAVTPAGSSDGELGRGKESEFLCFQRRSEHDLVMSGYKVLGGAQRRGRRMQMQHGSLLVRASDWAPSLPGVEDLTSRQFDDGAFTDAAQQWLVHRCGGSVTVQDRLPPAVIEWASAIAQNRFGSIKWWRRR